MGAIEITLAGEPRAWSRTGFKTKTGRFYTPSHMRKYQDALRYAAQEAMGDRPPLEGPVRVVVTATFPIPKGRPKWWIEAARTGNVYMTSTPDWENCGKQLDAFNQVVWRDDRQVADGRVIKVYGEKPSLTIIVEPLSEPAREAAPKPARRDAGTLAELPLMARAGAA